MPKVGFLKNIHQCDPARKTLWQKACSSITDWMVSFADRIRNEAVYSFFTTGVFRVRIPFNNVKYVNKDAVGSIDFIGLNYYSNRYLCLATTQLIEDDQLTSDGDYYHYPQGMYRAIVEIHEKLVKPFEQKSGKKLPMLVSENGIATNDEQKRSRFYHEYLYAISKAVNDGYPVYGYLPWTLFDNYEWPALENNKERSYGIFAIENNGQNIKIKQGSQPLIDFAQTVQT